MKQNFYWIIILVASVIVFSCNSTTPKKEAIAKISASNADNTGSLTCKINGELTKIDTVGILPYGGDESLQTCFASNNNYILQINFLKALTVGQTNTNCTAVVSVTNTNIRNSDVKSISVTITKKTERMVVGTFSFVVANDEDAKKIVTVTDGKFEGYITNF